MVRRLKLTHFSTLDLLHCPVVDDSRGFMLLGVSLVAARTNIASKGHICRLGRVDAR